MIAYLYCITNTITHKKYIGVTTDMDRRKSEHFSNSRKGSKLVQRAIEKYGEDNFIFTIIMEGEDTELYALEAKYILENNSLTPNGYNIAEGGRGGKTGPISEETKIKMSVAHTGKPRAPHSDESKLKISNAKKGHKTSIEVRKKMSETRQGSGNGMYGKFHSDETKNKIRLSKVGISSPTKGIPRTEEVKRKISETKKRNKLLKENS